MSLFSDSFYEKKPMLVFSSVQWSAFYAQVRRELRLLKTLHRLESSGLFDPDWYLLENPDLVQTNLNYCLHYIQYGASEGRNPNPLFDTSWYLAQNPEVAKAEINPLLHYLEYGFLEGRNPSPFFDTGWYRFINPEIVKTRTNPLVHYLQCDSLLRGDPHPAFDTQRYRIHTPDVVKNQVNPLLHYLFQGVLEGRSPGATNDAQFIQQAAEYRAALSISPHEALNYALSTQRNRHRLNSGRFVLSPIVTRLQTLCHYLLKKISQKFWKAAPQPTEKIAGFTAGTPDSEVLKFTSAEVLSQKIKRHADGRYAISADSPSYTYLPPAPPDDLQEQITAMQSSTYFSIVVPVYNTSPELLSSMVDSVIQQWYPRWELILVDDASTQPETQAQLAKILHSKIQIFHLKENLGIAGATNAAIAKATGDYIVFLDHDDELTHDCLYELARCIECHNPDFIYSDEDKVDIEGNFQEPHYKPEWSPDTFMSTMYTCHVSCVKRSIVDQIGKLKTEYDGCQDWDFILRVTELTQNIYHVPKVLYHWRVVSGSIAADFFAKPYSLEASKRVREAALSRRGISGFLEPLPQANGCFRVVYELIKAPLISIIVSCQDDASNLLACLQAIVATTAYSNFDIVVVSNIQLSADTHQKLYLLLEIPASITILDDRTFDNWGELQNLGADHARGELLLFLNADILVDQADWLERLGGFAQQSHIGAVGAKLLCPQTHRVQQGGIVNLAKGPAPAFRGQQKDDGGYFMRNLLEYNWLAVSGDCFMIERSKFEQVQGFSRELAIAYSAVDLCVRLYEQGFYQVVCQAVHLLLCGTQQSTDQVSAEYQAHQLASLQQFYERHPKYFQHDPFYSPHLNPNSTNFEYFV